MNNFKNKGIALLIIIGLIVYGIYYFLNNNGELSFNLNNQSWKTYIDKDNSFTFKYPADYENFKDGTSISKVSVDGETYPTIRIQISPLDNYKFNDASGGTEMKYDSKTKECMWGDKGYTMYPSKNKLYISGYLACIVLTGDAGGSIYGYAIPDEKNNRMIEITFITEEGKYRKLDTNTVINTFEFTSTSTTTK